MPPPHQYRCSVLSVPTYSNKDFILLELVLVINI